MSIHPSVTKSLYEPGARSLPQLPLLSWRSSWRGWTGPAGLSVIKTLTLSFRDPLMSKPIAPPVPHSLDAGLESSGALRTERGIS